MANLGQYTYITEFLTNVIQQRSVVRGYTRGMLTAHLLDPSEYTKADLDRLEKALQLGKEYCTDFQSIFHERKLPNRDLAIDGEMLNILAEVKAFEFLHVYGFRDIIKIKRKIDAKTVDFTAKRNSQNYAVEVTRLGLAQANRKKPVYMVKDKIPAHNIPGVRNLVGEFFIISGKDNIPRIRETIRDSIANKYRQIKDFCQIQDSSTKGIIFISSGRDYFVVNRYARTEFEISPKAVMEVLEYEWKSIKQLNAYGYLHHIVITMGRDINKVIIHPNL